MVRLNRKGVIGGTAIIAVAGAGLIGSCRFRSADAEARRAYDALLIPREAPERRFNPADVAQLPEIARRYFAHAIAPGTPLYSTAELRMEGTFLLGDKRAFQTYRMTARQAVRLPGEFVWMPKLRSGPFIIRGSDGLARRNAWTRFWMFSLLPIVDGKSSPDLVRSAQFRAAVEGALWLPPSLLPGNDVEWEQAGPDTAIVTLSRFRPDPVVLTLELDRNGAVKKVVGQRWSNANAEKRFRYQPFGGTIAREQTFQGLTIPTDVAVGNQFGTGDYFPFFQAQLTHVRYR